MCQKNRNEVFLQIDSMINKLSFMIESNVFEEQTRSQLFFSNKGEIDKSICCSFIRKNKTTDRLFFLCSVFKEKKKKNVCCWEKIVVSLSSTLGFFFIARPFLSKTLFYVEHIKDVRKRKIIYERTRKRKKMTFSNV